jgi:hypothetical protein
MWIPRLALKILPTLGVAVSAFAMPVGNAADPEPKAPATTVDKPADWSKFVNVGEIHGEVVKADESGLTLRVTWYAPKGGTNTRPQLNRGGGNAQRRPNNQRPPQSVEQHHDYVLKYADNGAVRQLKLPPKTDEKGRKVDYTVKELENAKKPVGMPHYAAARTDLQPGSTVEVMLVRPRGIPAEKVQESDMLVKYVVIHAAGKGTASSDTKK